MIPKSTICLWYDRDALDAADFYAATFPGSAGAPDASEFDDRRRHGELRSLVASRAGRTYLAEAYTGWPLATF